MAEPTPRKPPSPTSTASAWRPPRPAAAADAAAVSATRRSSSGPTSLVIEFIASLVMLLTLIILSWLVNAPLEAHSNPTARRTRPRRRGTS